MTYFGIVLCILFIYSLYKPYRYTVGLLYITCIFQASNTLNIGENGVQPYVLGEGFIIIRCILRTPNLIQRFFKDRFVHIVLFFMVYVLVITLLMPFYYEGMDVFANKNLDYSAIYGPEPLKFGVNNLTQLGYIFVNCITLCCLWVNRHRVQQEQLLSYFYWSIIIFLAIGFWEFIAKHCGLYFPSTFFYNNYGLDGRAYTIGTSDGVMRMNATMTEASYCGALLASIFWSVMAIYCRIGRLRDLSVVCLTAIALIFNLSGTGLLATLLGGVVFLVLERKRKNVFRTMAIMIIFASGIIYISGYWSYIVDMISTKNSSVSGIHRAVVLFNSWDVFCHSLGFGVGMGSNRGNSFPMDLLASVGLIGTALFYFIYIKLILHCKMYRRGEYIVVYMLVLMMAQTLAIPDFSFCSMWLGIFMAASFNGENNNLIEIAKT